MKSGIRVVLLATLLSTVLLVALVVAFAQMDVALADDGDDIELEVEKKVKAEGGKWKDADHPYDALKVEPGTPISWLIKIENESDMAATLTISDTLNGDTLSLSGCTSLGVLAANAESECEISGTAEEGTFVNVVTVTAEYEGDIQVTEHDVAVYVGMYGNFGGDHDDDDDDDEFEIEVEKKVKAAGGSWEDADHAHDALKIVPGTVISWLIKIENESDMTATLTISDALNGAELDIYDYDACDRPENDELGPDVTYTCEFSGTAEGGLHVNVVTVTAEYEGGPLVTERDAAIYVGTDAIEHEDEGCGQGYWKNHLGAWESTGYSTTHSYTETFDITAMISPSSVLSPLNLLEVLWLGGGREIALGRQAVAALLNAAHPDVNYPILVSDVISNVQDAYDTGEFQKLKDTLEYMNEDHCPLGKVDDDDDNGDDDHGHRHGVGTPHYWRLHPDEWPPVNLFVGHKRYSQQQALMLMNQANDEDDSGVSAAAGSDATLSLFSEAVAGRLNVADGNDATCVEDTLDAADDWLAANSVDGGVPVTDDAWQDAAPLYATLTDYNAGRLCAPAMADEAQPVLFLPLLR